MYGAVSVHWENYSILKMPSHLLCNSGTLFLLRSLMMRNRNVVEDALARSHPSSWIILTLVLGSRV